MDLLKETAKLGRLPVVNFAAGGLATPADCSLLMQLGVDGCFVGSGIFKSDNPKVSFLYSCKSPYDIFTNKV